MRIKPVLFAGLLTIGLVLSWTGPTNATTKAGERIAKEFNLDPKTSCVLCHDASKGEPGSRTLNKFGKDFDTAYLKAKKGGDRAITALQAIGADDADGDGATNLEEVALGTQPSDKTSVPAADKLTEYRNAKK